MPWWAALWFFFEVVVIPGAILSWCAVWGYRVEKSRWYHRGYMTALAELEQSRSEFRAAMHQAQLDAMEPCIYCEEKHDPRLVCSAYRDRLEGNDANFQ